MALDEAHSIKNAGTSKYRKLLQMPCTRRILLTGTPINNSLPELLVLLQVSFDTILGLFDRPLLTHY
jgi:SNF2 family DNA or RNA helicase